MSDYSGLIAELQRSCNGLNNKVKSLEEKTTALGEEEKRFSKELIEKLSKWQKEMAHKIEALETALKIIAEKVFLNMDDYREWLKQLEGKTEYYDIKTLTHFISDIVDWIKTQKSECQINGLMFDVIDIGELEQFLIDREKQMERYNKTITKKQLEVKQ